jgi:hypothetical protein
VDDELGHVRRVAKDATASEEVGTFPSDPFWLAADESAVYGVYDNADATGYVVARLSLSGGESVVLFEQMSNPEFLVAGEDALYFMGDSSMLSSVPKDAASLASETHALDEFVTVGRAYDGKLFLSGGVIGMSEFDEASGELTKLLDGAIGYVTSISPEEKYVYFTFSAGESLGVARVNR